MPTDDDYDGGNRLIVIVLHREVLCLSLEIVYTHRFAEDTINLKRTKFRNEPAVEQPWRDRILCQTGRAKRRVRLTSPRAV